MSSVKPNQSLARVFSVLEYLADHPDARLKDVALGAGLATPTALRFLGNLVALGYARQEGMRYRVSPRLASLSRGVWSHDLSAAVHNALVELANDTGLTAFFVVNDRDEAVYLQRGLPKQAGLISTQRIGARAPLYCTGVGKVFLAERTDGQIAEYCDNTQLTPLTEHTITDPETLLDRLHTIREFGVASDDEECELGVRCLAVPVRDDTKRVRAAVSISGPSAVVAPQPTADQRAALDSAARHIAELLPVSGW